MGTADLVQIAAAAAAKARRPPRHFASTSGARAWRSPGFCPSPRDVYSCESQIWTRSGALELRAGGVAGGGRRPVGSVAHGAACPADDG